MLRLLVFILLLITTTPLTRSTLQLPFNCKRLIQSGHPVVIRNCISKSDLISLRELSLALHNDGYFVPNGLRVSINDTNAFGNNDRLLCEEIPIEYADLTPLIALTSKIDSVRYALAALLDGRSSMANDDLDHESYMSIYTNGVSLERHLDERHEELRPSNRWIFHSRRSISWLLYLTDETWDATTGGALELFTPKKRVEEASHVVCGSYNGELQVGWMIFDGCTIPIYMTSSPISTVSNFVAVADGDDDLSSLVHESRLFKVSNSHDRQYITDTFTLQNASVNSVTSTFYKECMRYVQLYNMKYNVSNNLIPLEMLPGDDLVISKEVYYSYFVKHAIIPAPATLVLFDSVSLAHQVTEIIGNNSFRIAIGGWFHEAIKVNHKDGSVDR